MVKHAQFFCFNEKRGDDRRLCEGNEKSFFSRKTRPMELEYNILAWDVDFAFFLSMGV
jgi:hypothetical protein